MTVPLETLLELLDVARPGAHFPDVRRVKEWLSLLAKPWSGRTIPKLDLHPGSGFPTERSLTRLLDRQRIARDFFAHHRTRPPRSSDQFNVALAAAELWSPGTEAKVVSEHRLLLVHDRFDTRTGALVRFTVHLEQRGAKHVAVQRGTHATCTPVFVRALEHACDADATAAGVKLAALDGLTVHEVVKGELGALTPVIVPAGEALLAMTLERVGGTVAKDHVADAWPPEDAHAAKREALGWRRARDRKLVCTKAFEPALKELTRGTRMLVRSG